MLSIQIDDFYFDNFFSFFYASIVGVRFFQLRSQEFVLVSLRPNPYIISINQRIMLKKSFVYGVLLSPLLFLNQIVHGADITIPSEQTLTSAIAAVNASVSTFTNYIFAFIGVLMALWIGKKIMSFVTRLFSGR